MPRPALLGWEDAFVEFGGNGGVCPALIAESPHERQVVLFLLDRNERAAIVGKNESIADFADMEI